MSNKYVKKFFEQVDAPTYRDELNYFTMQCRLDVLKPHLHGLVLDVGFGPGKYHFKHKSFQVIALDISSNMLREAKKANPHMVFVVGDAQHLPFKEGIFNTLFSLEVIYYLSKPKLFISEAYRVLKAGGHCMIISINKIWDFIVTVVLRPFGLCPKEDISRHFISPKNILSWLKEATFSQSFIKSVCYLPHPLFNRLFAFLPPHFSFVLAFVGQK
ncbi:MAG: class I SAM-dependent methyltransferase [Promethearchaeota archaeon]